MNCINRNDEKYFFEIYLEQRLLLFDCTQQCFLSFDTTFNKASTVDVLNVSINKFDSMSY